MCLYRVQFAVIKVLKQQCLFSVEEKKQDYLLHLADTEKINKA